MNSKKLSSLKMCVEKFSTSDEEHLKAIGERRKLKAAFLTAKIWKKDSLITIGFLGTPDDIERTSITEIELQLNAKSMDPIQREIADMSIIDGIKKIVNERIAPLVNLQFVFVENPNDAIVRISFNPNQGAWSLLGTDCLNESDKTKATMNLGWFDVATTIHEFGHTLGLIHEHQNPIGKTIPWDDTKVYEWAKQTHGWDKETTFTNIIKKYNRNQINGTEFDPKSIMLYFFPASLTTNNEGTEENLRLSKYDAQYINTVYPTVIPASVFYMKAYGESISTPTDSEFPVLIILAVLCAVAVISMIVMFVFQNKK